MTALAEEIKQLIIETLDLEDLEIDEIVSDEPLIGEGLGLDSIDALELGIALQKKYGVKIDSKSDDVARHFASVTALAAFVEAHQHTKETA